MKRPTDHTREVAKEYRRVAGEMAGHVGRTLFLMNGGALVALLSFFATAERSNLVPAEGMVLFAAGMAFTLAYMLTAQRALLDHALEAEAGNIARKSDRTPGRVFSKNVPLADRFSLTFALLALAGFAGGTAFLLGYLNGINSPDPATLAEIQAAVCP